MNKTTNRPYKAAEPLTTINRIRRGLEECGLFTAEMCFYGLPADVACARVFTGDEDMLSFGVGTNGKGMNMRYALASAYAEFMERLQNGVLFPNRQLRFSPELFRFGPDEEKKTVREILDDCGDILEETFSFLPEHNAGEVLLQAIGGESILCAPFADVFGKKVRMLPIELFYQFTGSNGMSSGNTAAEAIVHGICEIMERYAMREIYMSRVTPPMIPQEEFEGTEVMSRLLNLSKDGYTFEIRDCSLSIGLPVIGLLLRNAQGAFTFHLGADPRPEIALERCLTEIFQGSGKDVSERFTTETLDFPCTRAEKARYCRQFCDATIRGTSPWPSSLLNTEFSYPFIPWPACGKNDGEDLLSLSALLRKNGYQLLIRNVSWLGFPSYYVYIPRMSELDLIYDDGSDFISTVHLSNLQKVFLSPRAAGINARAELVSEMRHALRESISAPLLPYGLFLLNTSRRLRNIGDLMIAAIFAASCNLYSLASSLVKDYLLSCENPANRKMLNALCFFWNERAKKTPDETIRRLMNLMFDRNTVNTCMTSGYGEAILDLFGWSECFSCEKCPEKKFCRFAELVNVLIPVQKRFSQDSLSQEKTLNLF